MKQIPILMVLLWLPVGSALTAQGSFTTTSGASVHINGAAYLHLKNVRWNNSGNFTAGASTVDLSGDQILGASADVFRHLHINRSSGNIALGKNISVGGNLSFSAGLLDLNGHDITLVQPGGALSGESETSRAFSAAGGTIRLTLGLNAPNQANPGLLGARITSAANLGTTLIARGHQPQSGACNAGIKRYYLIQPANNSGLNATLRLYYADAELNGIVENDLTLYRSDDGGASWTDVGFDQRNATENWVEKSGLSSLSRWTLGSASARLSEKLWVKDADGDGFTDGATQWACTQPNQYVASATAGDCNDTNAAIHPGVADQCEDHIDNDCDGLVDEGCPVLFGGTIRWSNDQLTGVQNAVVTLSGAGSGSNTTTAAGTYLISIPAVSGNFTLKPTKNLNKLNGVTSADVAAIQQHIANSVPLSGAFKRIAADINKSNSISSLDATMLNQALLGNPTALAQFSTSWRFVPAAYVFPNPNTPWGFPEQISLTGVSSSQYNQNFLGIKIGDVAAAYANPANFGAGAPLVWKLNDQLLETGQSANVDVSAGEQTDLAAFQFALHFDPAQLQLTGIDPDGSELPLTPDNFGTYNAAEGEIRAAWSQSAGVALHENAPVFRLKFKVLQGGGRLSEALWLEESELPALAYTSTLAESGVALEFYTSTTGTQSGAPEFLFGNRPNPFSGATTLSFVLPRETDAELRVTDVAGRVLFSEKQHYAAGKHERPLRLDGASGVLFAELLTEVGCVVRRMLAVR